MNKFHESDIVDKPAVDTIPIYELRRSVDINKMCCCVCGINPWNHGLSSRLYSWHTANIGEYYYVLPYSHTHCRELFNLNPLPYLTTHE